MVCGSDHLAVVSTHQTARSAGDLGPCIGGQRRAVGGSGEFGADWRDPLAFLGFLARTADAHKTRRKCEKDQIVCDLRTQLRCATTAAERRQCNRLLWRRRRALSRQRQLVFLQEAFEAKRSPVQRNWVRDRAWSARWRSGEAPFAKGVLGLLQVETSPVQPKPVVEGARESVWGKHSLECHVVQWQLDCLEAARTDVGILVCSSLEPDGGFQAQPSRRLRNFLEKAASQWT